MIDPLHHIVMSPAGVPWIVDPSGRKIAPAVISGGDGPDDTTTDDDGGDDDDEGSGGTNQTYTKAQLDSILGRASKRAEKEAQRKLAEQLGMDPVEAARLIKAASEKDAAAMSEADRKQADAERREAEAERVKAEAQLARVEARAEAKLARMQLDDDTIDFLLPSLKLTGDEEDDDIVDRIEAARAKVPHLFTPTTEQVKDRKPPPSSNGTRDKRRNPPPSSSIDRGKEYAKAFLERGTIV